MSTNNGSTTGNASSTASDTEEYTLPCLEALLAGCFALMTGYAQSASDCPHRPLLAAKLVSNLIRLSHHGALTPSMRSMLSNLTTRWQVEMENPAAHAHSPQPSPLWHTANNAVH